MKHSPARTLYLALLRMHPRSFRSEFAAEMLSTFDQAAAQYGSLWLIGDAARSVLRQQLLRDPEVALEAAPCTAVGLRSGVYPLVGPYEFLLSKLLLASVLTSILFQIIGPI